MVVIHHKNGLMRYLQALLTITLDLDPNSMI